MRISKDNTQFLAQYRCAAASGIVKAQEDADEITANMTPAELEKGNQSYQELREALI